MMIVLIVPSKMEITIGVAVGSSIQIAAGMIPLLVLIAWPMGQDLTLFFVSFFTNQNPHLPLLTSFPLPATPHLIPSPSEVAC
jgi:hypothetical protein